MKKYAFTIFVFSILTLPAIGAEISLKGNVPERISYQTFSIQGLTVLKNSSDAPLLVKLYKTNKGRLPASPIIENLSLNKGQNEIVIAHRNYRKIIIIAP